MQNDKSTPSNKKVCDLLLDQISKPENFYSCKAVNVYDNKYRVNIYSKKNDSIRISESYFIKYDGKDNNITIKL